MTGSAGPTGATGATGATGPGGFTTYRAGSVTVSGSGKTTIEVKFSSAMANEKYKASIVSDTSGPIITSSSTASGCILTVESQTASGFVFSCRFAQASSGGEQTFANGDVFDYMALPEN